MNYIIDRTEFLRGIEPMISIIKQGGYYFAVDDHGTNVCDDQGVEGIAQKILDIITHSLSLTWDGRKVRVRFVGESEEEVDFWIKSEGRNKFSLQLKSKEPKQEEAQQFLNIFRESPKKELKPYFYKRTLRNTHSGYGIVADSVEECPLDKTILIGGGVCIDNDCCKEQSPFMRIVGKAGSWIKCEATTKKMNDDPTAGQIDTCVVGYK